MNSWCAPSCPPRRSFVASDAHRRGQLCTVPTRPDSTYNSGNGVQTTGATSVPGVAKFANLCYNTYNIDIMGGRRMSRIDASRRRFLLTGSLALGGGLATLAGFDTAFARKGTNNGVDRQINALNNQFLAIGASPAALSVRQQFAHLVSDPALPTLARNTLRSAGTTLTGFQTALLEAVLVITYDPAALAATMVGSPLTKSQRITMNRVRGTLQNNPAVQRLIRAGATLKGQRSVLQSDINQMIANSSQSAPSFSVSGNPALASIVNDSTALSNSSAFGTLKAATVPLMETSAFLPYLRAQSPLTVVSYMPLKLATSLELPHQKDPPLALDISIILFFIASIVDTVGDNLEGRIATILGNIANGINITAALLALSQLWPTSKPKPSGTCANPPWGPCVMNNTVYNCGDPGYAECLNANGI